MCVSYLSTPSFLVIRLSFFISSWSINSSLCSITTSWSVVLNLARLIACGSGLSRLIWNFLVASKKYVLIIFAMKGKSVSSLYLKKAINAKSNKIGIATMNAANLLTPFLYKTFRIPNPNPSPIAKVTSCKMEILNGPIWTLILNHQPEILRGMKILYIYHIEQIRYKYIQ